MEELKHGRDERKRGPRASDSAGTGLDLDAGTHLCKGKMMKAVASSRVYRRLGIIPEPRAETNDAAAAPSKNLQRVHPAHEPRPRPRFLCPVGGSWAQCAIKSSGESLLGERAGVRASLSQINGSGWGEGNRDTRWPGRICASEEAYQPVEVHGGSARPAVTVVTRWTFLILAVCLLALTSCSKKDVATSKPQSSAEAMMQLRTTMASAKPETRKTFENLVEYNLRYGNSKAALDGLDKLSNDPTLDANQKKLVTEAIELVKAETQRPKS
jgi:hypothetical protein